MVAVQYIASVKLYVKPGKATAAPPVGPSLGQYSVNLKEFCDRVNKATTAMTQEPFWEGGDDVIVRVAVGVKKDKTFDISVKKEPVVAMIKRAANIKQGASDVKETIASISRADISRIAQRKLADSNAYDVSSYERSVEGTAKSMGIRVVD